MAGFVAVAVNKEPLDARGPRPAGGPFADVDGMVARVAPGARAALCRCGLWPATVPAGAGGSPSEREGVRRAAGSAAHGQAPRHRSERRAPAAGGRHPADVCPDVAVDRRRHRHSGAGLRRPLCSVDWPDGFAGGPAGRRKRNQRSIQGGRLSSQPRRHTGAGHQGWPGPHPGDRRVVRRTGNFGRRQECVRDESDPERRAPRKSLAAWDA